MTLYRDCDSEEPPTASRELQPTHLITLLPSPLMCWQIRAAMSSIFEMCKMPLLCVAPTNRTASISPACPQHPFPTQPRLLEPPTPPNDAITAQVLRDPRKRAEFDEERKQHPEAAAADLADEVREGRENMGRERRKKESKRRARANEQTS